MSYKNATRPFNKLAFVYISLIILLNAIGIGYGAWQKDTGMSTLISTGKIDPIISSYQIQETTSKALTTIDLSGDKKSMDILIDGAYPGYGVGIKYTITNQGTIPVHCKFSAQSIGSAGINISQPESDINGYGGTSEGTVNIKIYSLQNLENYKFTADLKFNQYNEILTE